MRSVVFAYQEVGYVCLAALLDMGAEVCAVFTHEDDPNEEIWFRSVRRLAEERDLPVFTPNGLTGGDWIERLRAWSPEFLFSFYYRRLLPSEVLQTARRAALNLHGSFLPRYRGRCPVNWVLIHGESETGVTLHHMVERPDRGDIVAQRRVPITEEDTVRTLYAKQTVAAEEMFRDIYPRLCDGTAPRIPQDHSQASYFGGRKPEDGRIDWVADAVSIHNLVRAVTHPYPGAFTHWQDKRLFVWEARPLPDLARAVTPGTVVGVGEGLDVQAAGGVLRVLRVQLEGEEELSGAEWARRHAVEPGCVLGLVV
jgi:methionyl-tRNA formyltransferase